MPERNLIAQAELLTGNRTTTIAQGRGWRTASLSHSRVDELPETIANFANVRLDLADRAVERARDSKIVSYSGQGCPSKPLEPRVEAGADIDDSSIAKKLVSKSRQGDGKVVENASFACRRGINKCVIY